MSNLRNGNVPCRYLCISHVDSKILMLNLINGPCHVTNMFSNVDRLHVDFKKRQCRPVECNGQGPHISFIKILHDTNPLHAKPVEFNSPYTPPGRDLYCSPCRLYEPTYRSSPHIPPEEVMWQAEEEVYSDNLLRRYMWRRPVGWFI